MQDKLPLTANERTLFALRSLYGSYGYSLYKMSKFEEYDLYSENKDFLVSDGVITFTDTNGKLMALKPDVTLSLIKNTRRDGNPVQKLYYNENVYRVSKSTHGFREIMQAGLECTGDIDALCVLEVITLAAESLKLISENYVLSVSHLGVLSEVLENAGVPASAKGEMLRLIGEKNQHGIAALCLSHGVAAENAAVLKKLAAFHGTSSEAAALLNGLPEGLCGEKTLADFSAAVSGLDRCGEKINIDFSVVDDTNYYNGIIFKGFIEGVPNSVLSGGRYDSLMRRMHRNEGAIGFAVYLDELEFINRSADEYDVDVLLLYSAEDEPVEIQKAACALRSSGSVLTARRIPEDLRYKKLVKYENGEVKTRENDA